MGGRTVKNKKALTRYIPVIISCAALPLALLLFPDKAPAIGRSLLIQTLTIFLVVPPIFLLLGLLDVWVPREKMIALMGEGSGFRGVALAFALGSAAAGPLYGAFPVAGVLMKKGASFSIILIFIGAWSTTKIPMLLFEMKALGYRTSGHRHRRHRHHRPGIESTDRGKREKAHF